MVHKKLESYRQKLSSASRTNKIIALAVAAIVVIAGLAVFSSMAATPFASLEAESASRQGPATVVNDNTASNNSALKFGDEPVPDTTPPPPDSEITHGSQLTLSHVGPSGQLTPSSSITTTSDGQIIENVEVTGSISVRHKNVVIRNVRVLTTGLYGVAIPASFNSTASFTLEYSEVRGVPDSAGSRSACVVHYGAWTIKRSIIGGDCTDSVKIGSDTHIIESIIRGPYYRGPNNDGHNDAIQAVGGSNMSVVRSKVQGPYRAQTSALILQSDVVPLSNVTLVDNELSGGNYTLYLRAKTGQPNPANITVKNNIWVKDSWFYGTTSMQVGTGWVWENNRTDDGTPVTCGSCN